LREAEAKHLQANGGKPRLYFAKPVKKVRGKPKPRKIYLNERAYAICKRLAEIYPTGKLFSTSAHAILRAARPNT
jgi:hypothetical protein